MGLWKPCFERPFQQHSLSIRKIALQFLLVHVDEVGIVRVLVSLIEHLILCLEIGVKAAHRVFIMVVYAIAANHVIVAQKRRDKRYVLIICDICGLAYDGLASREVALRHKHIDTLIAFIVCTILRIGHNCTTIIRNLVLLL